MQTKPYQNAAIKAKPKLLKLAPDGSATELRLGGTAPAEDMKPDTYPAKCDAAWMDHKGKGRLSILQYRLIDGKFDGVGLRQWLPVSNGGNVISPTSRYAKQCEIALGRPLNEEDPYADPAAIFVGKQFLVFVGYRKTERPRGGGRTSDDLALHKKGDADYLKVHDIISREDL